MNAEQKPQRLTGHEADLFFGLKVLALLFLLIVSLGDITASLCTCQR
jgi:hypothetical protein